MDNLVDVHTHLTDPKFAPDIANVVARAKDLGVRSIISNGLNPSTNRMVLQLAANYPTILPALGIYPIDAVNDQLPPDLPFAVEKFDVDAEIEFIRKCAKEHRIVAVGECGLDGHWLKEPTFARQEAVFEKLIEVALESDLPLIIHTRKLEKRSIEILAGHKVRKVNFHCFGGKTSLAKNASETHGWWFSIPANARNSESFTKMLRELPIHRILTETDAPYLPPRKGERNSPENIPGTVQYFAELRGLSVEEAAGQIQKNFQELFGPSVARLKRA